MSWLPFPPWDLLLPASDPFICKSLLLFWLWVVYGVGLGASDGEFCVCHTCFCWLFRFHYQARGHLNGGTCRVVLLVWGWAQLLLCLWSMVTWHKLYQKIPQVSAHWVKSLFFSSAFEFQPLCHTCAVKRVYNFTCIVVGFFHLALFWALLLKPFTF